MQKKEKPQNICIFAVIQKRAGWEVTWKRSRFSVTSGGRESLTAQENKGVMEQYFTKANGLTSLTSAISRPGTNPNKIKKWLIYGTVRH